MITAFLNCGTIESRSPFASIREDSEKNTLLATPENAITTAAMLDATTKRPIPSADPNFVRRNSGK
jgi:hypothetical protein